jgi:hypothetical protein
MHLRRIQFPYKYGGQSALVPTCQIRRETQTLGRAFRLIDVNEQIL